MKTELVSLTLFSIVCSLLIGCTTTPSTSDSPISLPASFEEVWYRPTLDKPVLTVMTDTGTVTVRTDGIAFVGEKGDMEIDYGKIQKVSFGKVGADFFNNWVTIKYRDGEEDSYALFSCGKNLGWDCSGVVDRIFQSIRFALNQKGMASVVEE